MIVAPQQAQRTRLQHVHFVRPAHLDLAEAFAQIVRIRDDNLIGRAVLHPRRQLWRQIDVAQNAAIRENVHAQIAAHPMFGILRLGQLEGEAIVAFCGRLNGGMFFLNMISSLSDHFQFPLTTIGKVPTSRQIVFPTLHCQRLRVVRTSANHIVFHTAASTTCTAAVRLDLILRDTAVARLQRNRRMIAHQSAILVGALETTAGQKLLIRRTPMGHILAFAIDAVDEQLNRTHMIARQQHARRLLDAVFDQRERHNRGALLRQRTARLLLAVVRIEVDVAARFGHAVAGYFEHEEIPTVRVDDVDEFRIARIEAQLWAHALEVRLGRIESGDSAEIRNAFAGIAGRMGAKRMANQVDVFGLQAVLVAQFVDQIGDFQADDARVGRCLRNGMNTGENLGDYESSGSISAYARFIG